jgi:hypothetical protein
MWKHIIIIKAFGEDRLKSLTLRIFNIFISVTFAEKLMGYNMYVLYTELL